MKKIILHTAKLTDLSNLIDQANESHQPIHIHSKRKNAVLIAEEDWQAIEETLYLLSIPGMRKSIRKDLETPLDKCFKELP